MSDQYPRVARLDGIDSIPPAYVVDANGPSMVVPWGSTVMQELPDIEPYGGSAVRIRDLIFDTSEWSAEAALSQAARLIALAEHITAQRSSTNERVEELAEDMVMAGASAAVSEGDSEAFSRAMDVIARRLVEQGWTKPEPTP